MRLIDADTLIQAIHDEWDEVIVWDESGETTADEFVKLVDSAPTIDAEPVVRCKDCIHCIKEDCWTENGIVTLNNCWNYKGMFTYMRDNDYCSRGKRRDSNVEEKT